MQRLNATGIKQTATCCSIAAMLAFGPGIGFSVPALAQGPPMYSPGQLENMVSRIALYPDPLLAQILAAATFPNEIPDAAAWANQHSYLKGDALAQAIEGDRLPWNPPVQAMLPFPSVLNMMAGDMGWTTGLGNAFLAQRDQVMGAVQRQRRRARDYGYLRSGGPIVVSGGPYIEIMPVNPGYIVVPAYNPMVVYARPRPGFFVGGAISFGAGFTIGAAFRPWGWGGNRFGWANHTTIINNTTWNRTYVNRTTYVHPYAVQRYRPQQRVEEHHDRRPQRGDQRDRGRDDHDHGRDR
ncbi:MAG: DUF3300 domain-containing protein [Pseudomonadota bacterium]